MQIGTIGQIITGHATIPVAVYDILNDKRILLSEYAIQNGKPKPDLSKNAIVHCFTLRSNGQWIRQGDQAKNGDKFLPGLNTRSLAN